MSPRSKAGGTRHWPWIIPLFCACLPMVGDPIPARWIEPREFSTVIGDEGRTRIVDFGALTAGRLEIETTLEPGPGPVHITFAEARRDLDVEIPDGVHPVTIEAVPREGRWRDDRIRAFRWLRIRASEAHLAEITGMRVEASYPEAPVGQRAGSFRSSDARLDRMWQVGADTVRLCTEPGPDGLLLDGADRDRAVWAADLAVAVRVLAASGPDLAPVRRSLLHLARTHRPGDPAVASTDHQGVGELVDYGSWWTLALARYVRESDDIATARELFPTVVEQARVVLARIESDGLVHKRPGELEWSYTLQRGGAVTYLNVVAAEGLVAAAQLAGRVGEVTAGAAFAAAAARLRGTVEARLWDEQRGLFSTSPADPRVSLDANALPLAFGWLEGERRLRALAGIRARLWTPFGTLNVDRPYGQLPGPEHNGRVWPFLVYFEAEARLSGHTGTRDAFELMERTWGNMMDRDPGNSFWEWVGPDGGPETPRTSLAHAWSAGVTALLTERVLGVRVLDARVYVVEPVPGHLTHAQGRRPTPWGPIDVAWLRGAELGSFELDVEIPGQVGLARVRLPGVGGGARVTLDGEAVRWQAHGGGAVVSLPSVAALPGGDPGRRRFRLVASRAASP